MPEISFYNDFALMGEILEWTDVLTYCGSISAAARFGAALIKVAN